MKQGGARKGAGRKSSWSSSETKSVRIPALFVPEVLAYAKKLDREHSLSELLEEAMQCYGENQQGCVESLDNLRAILSDFYNHRYKAQSCEAYSWEALSSPLEVSVSKLSSNAENQSIAREINWTIKDFGNCKVLEIGNGQQIRLENQHGRWVCPTLKSPQESVELFVDDKDGKVYLRVCTNWNINHLLASEPVSTEEGSILNTGS